MIITWLGHSCFKIESNGYSVVLDPYANGYVPGLGNIDVSTNQVICSHNHSDHNAKEVVTIISTNSTPFSIELIPTYHDDKMGTLRGTNNITIIDDGTSIIAHFGDLGCMLTKEQIDKLSHLDAILIPVGGFYTINSKQAYEIVKQLNPKHVIPMHYQGESFGYGVLEKVDSFIKYFDKLTYKDTNTTSLDEDTQLVVLKYRG